MEKRKTIWPGKLFSRLGVAGKPVGFCSFGVIGIF
jgi:hypothetical protein